MTRKELLSVVTKICEENLKIPDKISVKEEFNTCSNENPGLEYPCEELTYWIHCWYHMNIQICAMGSSVTNLLKDFTQKLDELVLRGGIEDERIEITKDCPY